MVDLPSLQDESGSRALTKKGRDGGIDTMAILNRKKHVAVCNRKCHGCFQIALTPGERKGFNLTSWAKSKSGVNCQHLTRPILVALGHTKKQSNFLDFGSPCPYLFWESRPCFCRISRVSGASSPIGFNNKTWPDTYDSGYKCVHQENQNLSISATDGNDEDSPWFIPNAQSQTWTEKEKLGRLTNPPRKLCTHLPPKLSTWSGTKPKRCFKASNCSADSGKPCCTVALRCIGFRGFRCWRVLLSLPGPWLFLQGPQTLGCYRSWSCRILVRQSSAKALKILVAYVNGHM